MRSAAKLHTTTSYSEAKANELGVNVTRADQPPPPRPEDRPKPSAATTEGRYFAVQDDLPEFGMLLRLDHVTDDGCDSLLATFYGKPSTHGNHFSVPMGREDAARLKVGSEYLFILAEQR